MVKFLQALDAKLGGELLNLNQAWNQGGLPETWVYQAPPSNSHGCVLFLHK